MFYVKILMIIVLEINFEHERLNICKRARSVVEKATGDAQIEAVDEEMLWLFDIQYKHIILISW